ncbi:MAG TPA: hypothetical protein VLI93_00470, partial [Acetobacteraceae bacterium]|nr:hypothetical protein [Acetobacteraceae bacterium]
TNMVVTLDDKGSGSVTGDFVVHSPGIGELAQSKVVAKLSKLFDKTGHFDVPIKEYIVDFGAMSTVMPNPLITKALQKLILSRIRVTASSGETELKIPFVGTSKPSDWGQQSGSSGTGPIFTARQAFQSKKSRGAMNLQAYMQNMLQAQLEAVRNSLLS